MERSVIYDRFPHADRHTPSATKCFGAGRVKSRARASRNHGSDSYKVVMCTGTVQRVRRQSGGPREPYPRPRTWHCWR